jgi:hypothetical protein
MLNVEKWRILLGHLTDARVDCDNVVLIGPTRPRKPTRKS